MRKVSLLILLTLLTVGMRAASVPQEFGPVCDSLSSRMEARNGVKTRFALKKIHCHKGRIHFYFQKQLGDYPFRPQDIRWFKNQLTELMPPAYKKYRLGQIYVGKLNLQDLAVSAPASDGKVQKSDFRLKRAPSRQNPLVYKEDELHFKSGLEGRHLALWNSHGYYFNQEHLSWLWQRPPLFGTLEDLFTTSFVLPFLVPMLENAGAVVLLPRERDFSSEEYIIDNDSSHTSRSHGTIEIKGNWKNCGVGFADNKENYSGTDNPFQMGSAMGIRGRHKAQAYFTWQFRLPKKGNYAVYVSYKTLKESTSEAHYTLYHRGGKDGFRVNQKMGGGTWVYLGHFDLDENSYLVLDNGTKDGGWVSADAVKIGGGMGNIERESTDSTIFDSPTVSGKARYAEGARYWMQWAGVDSTVYSQNRHGNDYRDDFMSRGAWVGWLSAGSRVYPGNFIPPKDTEGKEQAPRKGKGIPIDASLALHTNAGFHLADSTYGTLAIYTLYNEKSRKLPSGENRLCQREFADILQTQLVSDIRHEMHPEWRRKGLWDRSYSESRTPEVPAVLMELLSHQSFNDMKLGIDPRFKFLTSRSLYKGILKYLSRRYGCQYVVQPLPVRNFSALLYPETVRTGVSHASASHDTDVARVELSWRERVDSLEETAKPTGFILQTRIDDGVFDKGKVLRINADELGIYRHTITLEKGHRYTFRVLAFNEGGKSFPSENLSVGVVENSLGTVLIINNFTRVSGPAYQEGEERASFQYHLDSGVPYLSDCSYIGDMYEDRRHIKWQDDHSPGFGASYADYAGKIRGGNSFDYPAIHGKEFFDLGYNYCSVSRDAFMEQGFGSYTVVDVICGKQTGIPDRQGKIHYAVFPHDLCNRLMTYSEQGCHLLVSGSYIASDLWDGIFVQDTSILNEERKNFVQSILGYRWMTGRASRTGEIRAIHRGVDFDARNIRKTFHICMDMCDSLYRVDSPDGIVPSTEKGKVIFRYTDNNISAAVAHEGEGYKALSFGFPLESIVETEKRQKLFQEIMNYFNPAME